VFSLCFAAGLCEGYDLLVAGVAAPKFAPALGLGAGDLGWVFAAAGMGLMVGAILGGRLADHVGRRPVLVLSLLVMSAFSIGSAFAPDRTAMLTMRFLTGLGLGGALPNMLALVHETSPPDRTRKRVTMLGSAIPLGGATLGLLLLIMPTLPWRTMFWLGGIAPLLVAVCCQILMPRMTVRPPDRPAATGVVVFALTGEQRASATMLLWVTILCVSVSVAMMTNWLPSQLAARGFPGTSMGRIVMMLTLGGAAGGLVFGLIAGGRGSVLVQRSAWTGMIASLLMLLAAGSSEGMVAAASFGTGFFSNGAQFLLLGIATDLYPHVLRGTGTGFAVGVGRLGAVLGPIVGGAVLAGTGQADSAFWTLIPLLLLSLVTGGILWRAVQRELLPSAAHCGTGAINALGQGSAATSC
jgi:AAHS family 3-hydroxyphenylpropionic acid transporter